MSNFQASWLVANDVIYQNNQSDCFKSLSPIMFAQKFNFSSNLDAKINQNTVLCKSLDMLCSVWSKMDTIQTSFVYTKVLPRSCLSGIFWSLIRPFKWGTAWSSISRGIKNICSQSQQFQKRPTLLSKLW